MMASRHVQAAAPSPQTASGPESNEPVNHMYRDMPKKVAVNLAGGLPVCLEPTISRFQLSAPIV